MCLYTLLLYIYAYAKNECFPYMIISYYYGWSLERTCKMVTNWLDDPHVHSLRVCVSEKQSKQHFVILFKLQKKSTYVINFSNVPESHIKAVKKFNCVH